MYEALQIMGYLYTGAGFLPSTVPLISFTWVCFKNYIETLKSVGFSVNFPPLTKDLLALGPNLKTP